MRQTESTSMARRARSWLGMRSLLSFHGQRIFRFVAFAWVSRLVSGVPLREKTVRLAQVSNG
jgi:hypothetical protein